MADGQTISGLALFVVRRFSYGCCICTGKHEALETLHVFQRLMKHVSLPLHRSWNQCDFVKILGLREGEDVVSIIPCCCCYTRELLHALIHLNAKNKPPHPLPTTSFFIGFISVLWLWNENEIVSPEELHQHSEKGVGSKAMIQSSFSYTYI